MQSIKWLAVGTLLCGSLLSAHAQLNFTLNNSPQSITAGGFATFTATLTNTGVTPINLSDFTGLTFSPGFLGDLSLDQTYFNNFAPLAANGGTATGNLFRLKLDSGATVPQTYTGTVEVNYLYGGVPSSTATQSLTVNSKTPTPPVVLVTLMSGIGTARIALARRKKAA